MLLKQVVQAKQENTPRVEDMIVKQKSLPLYFNSETLKNMKRFCFRFIFLTGLNLNELY